ncbi:MAG: Bax inhibitor-1/YccA family protein [Candidatus Acidiferrales bacterium]
MGVGESMTLQGTVNKTGFLLLCVTVSAAWTWGLARSESPAAAAPWMIGGLVGGFIVALVTIFKKEWSPFTSPIYALLEGLALGGISSFLDQRFPGIAIHAVALTFGTLAVMLFAYTSGLIRATQKFKIGVIAATGGIVVVYVIDIVLRFFGMHVPLINDSGPWGIAISLFIVGVAALNLILDFDFVETGVQEHAAKYMEWYGAFGLMVTLIWLYLEMLRLLSKLQRR